jgi:uncharacterized protein YbjT (DUF2867 family)
MIVVTGATGNVGRVLVPALGDAVRAVSRPEVDLTRPDTLRPALDGADALYLLVPGAGAGLNPHDLLDVAKSAGVHRVVLQSSQGAGTRPGVRSHAPLRAFEDAVRESGMDWTILRPGGFASNAFAWARSIRDHRTVVAPYGDVGLPIIDPADIAAVAAAVLRDPAHDGHTYVLTGPAPTTPRDRTAALASALGVPLHFAEQTHEKARTAMLTFMPEPVVDGTLDILGAPLPAEQRVSPDVERVLGHPGHPFTDWATRNVAAFR